GCHFRGQSLLHVLERVHRSPLLTSGAVHRLPVIRGNEAVRERPPALAGARSSAANARATDPSTNCLDNLTQILVRASGLTFALPLAAIEPGRRLHTRRPDEACFDTIGSRKQTTSSRCASICPRGVQEFESQRK